MRRAVRLAIVVVVAFCAASVLLTENALHVWNTAPPADAEAGAIAMQGAASWKPVSVESNHGAMLKAWMFTPRQSNGAGVILMHGVADTRLGMSGHAPFLLRAGYTVLMPDSRGHGGSNGRIITYGVRESHDVSAGPTCCRANQTWYVCMGSANRWGRQSCLSPSPVSPDFAPWWQIVPSRPLRRSQMTGSRNMESEAARFVGRSSSLASHTRAFVMASISGAHRRRLHYSAPTRLSC